MSRIRTIIPTAKGTTLETPFGNAAFDIHGEADVAPEVAEFLLGIPGYLDPAAPAVPSAPAAPAAAAAAATVAAAPSPALDSLQAAIAWLGGLSDVPTLTTVAKAALLRLKGLDVYLDPVDIPAPEAAPEDAPTTEFPTEAKALVAFIGECSDPEQLGLIAADPRPSVKKALLARLQELNAAAAPAAAEAESEPPA